MRTTTIDQWGPVSSRVEWKTEEKVKPKGTDGRKLQMLISATEEPKFTNPWGSEWRGSWFFGGNNLIDATGDVTVFLREIPKELKLRTTTKDYVIGGWSADNLANKFLNKVTFEGKGSNNIVTRASDLVLIDGHE
ncbi:MAG: hypothetical protein AAGI38_20595 [Bacteroidota bacterium]